MNRITIGVIALLALVAGSFVSVASPAAAQDGGSLTIHNRICPTNYEGDAYFEDCHETAPDPGLTFTLTNGATQGGTTDAEGNVAFTGLPEDTYTIQGGVPGEFAEYVVFCSVGADGQEQVEFEYVNGGIQLTVPADTAITCDWYNIPTDLSGEPTATAPAGDDASVTIYKTACPPGYAGDDYFDDCYDDPQSDVEFFIARQEGGVAGTTGADGLVTITMPADVLPGDVSAQETVPAGYAVDFYVYCTKDDGDTVLDIEQSTGAAGPDGSTTFFAVFDVETGDEIRCDWYNIPPADDGEPTPTPTGPTPTATPVPEGYPAQIRTGDCDDDDAGELVTDLTDVVLPEGDEVGHEDAVPAAASLTVLSRSLDELLADDYVLVVYPLDEADTDEPILCGAIGGILTSDGNLIFGLSEQNQSDFTGTAYVEPVPDDSSRSRISVLIAEDLAEDDIPAEEDENNAP